MSTDTAKPSIEAEFMAAMATPTPAAVIVNDVKGTTEAVATQAPAPSEDPKPTAETPKPEAPPSLARRLATLAAADKRMKDAETARAAKDAELAPALERLSRAKGAKTRAEAARIALELDDEAEADLFLELHQKFEGTEKAKPRDPDAEMERKIEAKLEAKLKALETAKIANDEKVLLQMRENYTAETLAALDAKADDFPLVSIAPPSLVDITAISEAWHLANGEIPEPEMVLKLIQDERQTKLDERRKAAETKKSSAKPAPAATGETSGPKAKPIRDNDVTVSPPRKLSIAEEFSEAYRATSGA